MEKENETDEEEARLFPDRYELGKLSKHKLEENLEESGIKLKEKDSDIEVT